MPRSLDFETWEAAQTHDSGRYLLPQPRQLALAVFRQRVDHLARLGVVQLFARLVLDRIGVRLQPLDLLAQLRVLLSMSLISFCSARSSARFCCHTESPCLPLITCHISSGASPTASTVPAGRHSRAPRPGSRSLRRRAPAPRLALPARPHSGFSSATSASIHFYVYDSTNFSAAALRASMSCSLRASV